MNDKHIFIMRKNSKWNRIQMQLCISIDFLRQVVPILYLWRNLDPSPCNVQFRGDQVTFISWEGYTMGILRIKLNSFLHLENGYIIIRPYKASFSDISKDHSKAKELDLSKNNSFITKTPHYVTKVERALNWSNRCKNSGESFLVSGFHTVIFSLSSK